MKSNNSVRATSRTSQMSVIVHTEVSGSGAAGYQYAKCVFFEVLFFVFGHPQVGWGLRTWREKKYWVNPRKCLIFWRSKLKVNQFLNLEAKSWHPLVLTDKPSRLLLFLFICVYCLKYRNKYIPQTSIRALILPIFIISIFCTPIPKQEYHLCQRVI